MPNVTSVGRAPNVLLISRLRTSRSIENYIIYAAIIVHYRPGIYKIMSELKKLIQITQPFGRPHSLNWTFAAEFFSFFISYS